MKLCGNHPLLRCSHSIPQHGGLWEGVTSILLKCPRNGPCSWQGSYSHKRCRWPHTLSTLQPDPESPNASFGPLSSYRHSAITAQPAPLHCCCLQVDLNLAEEAVLNPSSPARVMPPNHARSSWTLHHIRLWIAFYLWWNFKLKETKVDSPFPLLKDPWFTSKRKIINSHPSSSRNFVCALYLAYELIHIEAPAAFSSFAIQILLQKKKKKEPKLLLSSNGSWEKLFTFKLSNCLQFEIWIKQHPYMVAHQFPLLCLNVKLGLLETLFAN